MQMLQQIVALVLLSMVASSVGQYDTVKLVLQWPISYSNVLGTDCKPSVPDTFTIHGLWYKKNSKRPYPSFDPNILQPDLRTQLSRVWPNLKLDGNDLQFWSYEWGKHGKCNVDDPADYFQTTLNLYSRYADVLPSIRDSLLSKQKVYKPQEIVRIIRKVTKRIPELRCSTDNYGRNQLQEIVLCFDREGTEYILKDCGANMFVQCLDSNIIFPSPPRPRTSPSTESGPPLQENAWFALDDAITKKSFSFREK